MTDNCQLCHGACGGVRGNENVMPSGVVVCDYCGARQHSGTWLVLRHGARRTDNWRVVFHGPEERARKKYDAVALNLRQGTVELVSPSERVSMDSAPRLRTRW